MWALVVLRVLVVIVVVVAVVVRSARSPMTMSLTLALIVALIVTLALSLGRVREGERTLRSKVGEEGLELALGCRDGRWGILSTGGLWGISLVTLVTLVSLMTLGMSLALLMTLRMDRRRGEGGRVMGREKDLGRDVRVILKVALILLLLLLFP